MSDYALPEIELMKAQSEFLLDSSTTFLGLTGSFRSGKTFVACIKAVYLASQNIGYNGLMTEPTASMLAGILIPTFEDVMSLMGWKDFKSPGECWYEIYASAVNSRIELHFVEGEVTIFLRASENWNRIRGFSLAWFISDEFDTSDFDTCNQAWMKMVGRLTKGNVKQGCVTSTKEGFKWLYKYFITEASPEKRMIDIFVQNNPFIDTDYIERMRSELTEKQFAAYIKNEFVNFTSGNVYDAYDRILNRSNETLEKHPHAPINAGIDFNKNKMATVVALIINGVVHVVDEIYGCRNTEDLIREMRKRYPHRLVNCFVDFSGSYNASSAYTDASLTDVQQLQQVFGIDNVRYYRGHLPIVGDAGKVNRVGIVNQKFKNAAGFRGLLVNDSKCPQLAKCLLAQGYVEGKPDKANDVDHFPDALGYMISFIFLPAAMRPSIKVN